MWKRITRGKVEVFVGGEVLPTLGQRPSPRDDRDAAQDLARDLADVAAQISSLKGDANAYLTDPK